MEQAIDISSWDSFKILERLNHEIDSYIHILDFLIGNGRVGQDTFSYYEQKYISTHIDFVLEKEKFEKELKDMFKDKNFSWQIDFFEKTVVIKEYE